MRSSLKTGFEKYLDGDQREFNAQWKYLEMILNRWDNLDNIAISGNYPAWYRILYIFWLDIRYRVKQKLYLNKMKKENKQDVEMKWKAFENKIESRFEEARELIFVKTENREFQEHIFSEAELKLREIQKVLFQVVFQAGLIFPNRIERNWEDVVRSNFL